LIWFDEWMGKNSLICVRVLSIIFAREQLEQSVHFSKPMSPCFFFRMESKYVLLSFTLPSRYYLSEHHDVSFDFLDSPSATGLSEDTRY
jgi:hypothetical protein